ncbi:SigE family RNA polymerase sigma factor [Janibacter sp. GXQ6167]|uniref:SigE family RNA polymerase sigma factor n=1 Tax=Janibacter sp. GXQ6167 TaxID=3240791 RepID=UPI0035246F7B
MSSTAEDFEAWVRRARPGLLRTAVLLCGGDHGRAEDAVQETLVKVAERWRSIVRGGDPTPYARTVLYRLTVDDWRRRARRAETLGEVPDRPIQRDETSASDEALVLLEALGRLTPRQRAVLVLRFYEDLTERQAAVALGCSVNTIKSQSRHAIERLKVLAPELIDALAPSETGSTS